MGQITLFYLFLTCLGRFRQVLRTFSNSFVCLRPSRKIHLMPAEGSLSSTSQKLRLFQWHPREDSACFNTLLIYRIWLSHMVTYSTSRFTYCCGTFTTSVELDLVSPYFYVFGVHSCTVYSKYIFLYFDVKLRSSKFFIVIMLYRCV